jgi:hypothetical protein
LKVSDFFFFKQHRRTPTRLQSAARGLLGFGGNGGDRGDGGRGTHDAQRSHLCRSLWLQQGVMDGKP